MPTCVTPQDTRISRNTTSVNYGGDFGPGPIFVPIFHSRLAPPGFVSTVLPAPLSAGVKAATHTSIFRVSGVRIRKEQNIVKISR